MSEPSPNVVVVAGPNGSGKSTAAPALLRDYLPIVDAWMMFDNSRREGYELIVRGRTGTESVVANQAIWRSIQEKYA